jgi:regulator of replication initiation timing
LDEILSRILQTETNNAELKERLTAMEKDNSNLRKDNDDLRKIVTNLEVRLTAVEKDNDDLRKITADMEATLRTTMVAVMGVGFPIL